MSVQTNIEDFDGAIPDDEMESDTTLLAKICINNLLSFGPAVQEVPLSSLNILIGANGAGKSNLIEAILLLRSTPKDLEGTIRSGGGITEWMWKGTPKEASTLIAHFVQKDGILLHQLALRANDQRLEMAYEAITGMQVPSGASSHVFWYYNYHERKPTILIDNKEYLVPLNDFNLNDSILAQRKDPDRYPKLSYLIDQYNRIRVYREWSFGRNTIFRQPQRADMRSDVLAEDFSNLGMFLNRLRRIPAAKNAILKRLRDIYEGVDDFDVIVEGGTVQVFFTEGDFTIPATRLSDGTLRYLCLLAILCDPTPPPLICIEEPELGLHPDIIPKIADLLVEASTRTQLIVTTHSDILVDAMTERPEAVLVCEKHDRQTRITRLNAADLAVWLEKYRLGELWTSGELGGTRW